MNAVIDERSFDKLIGYIEKAKESPVVEIVAGGNYDKSKGYFIQPTVLLTQDPQYVTMCEELLGPIIILEIRVLVHSVIILIIAEVIDILSRHPSIISSGLNITQ